MVTEIENRLVDFCRTKETLIIYGAGRFGELVKDFLEQKNIAITSFCVTSIDEREIYFGYPVKEIAEVRRDYADAGIIVAVNEKYSVGVLKEVKGLDYFYDNSLLDAIDYNNTMEKGKEWIKQVEISGGGYFAGLENTCFFEIQHI